MLIKKRGKKSQGEGAVQGADLERKVTYCFGAWSWFFLSSYRIQAWRSLSLISEDREQKCVEPSVLDQWLLLI